MNARLAAHRPSVSSFFVFFLLLHASPGRAHAEPFLRGDANGDGRVDITDPVRLLAHLFLAQPAPGCVDAADADDSGTVDLTDAVFSLTFLFRGGPQPPPPGHLSCGFDPTGDVLECEESSFCAATPRRLIVAVLDSGVEAAHPDLTGQLLPGIDLIDRTGNPEDALGHGTEASVLIAGLGAVRGECPDCLILPVKVADELGHAAQELLAEGIDYAAQVGARVILVGLGSRGGGQALLDAVSRAESLGAVVVAPAGNLGTAHTLFPAAFPGVVSVVALDPAGVFLPTASTSGFETVGAAAKDISSSGLGGAAVVRSGSSVAAARVAGIAGRILAQDPTLAPAQVRQALRHGIDPVPLAGWSDVFDYGRIDSGKAAARAAAAPLDVAVTRLTVSPARPLVGQAHGLRIHVVNRGLAATGELSLTVTRAGVPVGDPIALPSLDVEGAFDRDLDLPAAVAAGPVEIAAAVAPLAGETAVADNRRAVTVAYTEEAVHDVDVLVGEIAAPLVEEGGIDLPITVRNRGNQDEGAVLLEVRLEDELVSSRSLALAAGAATTLVEAWTIGEDHSARNRGLRIAVSIPAEEASLERNEQHFELSVGRRSDAARLQYADTPNAVDIVMDAPWMTTRPYVPVLFFTPQFTKGGSRSIDRIAIGSYVAGAADFAANLFIDNRLDERDGATEVDFRVPGTEIRDPQGALRAPLSMVERFGSFWHYIVRVPVGSLGGGPSEKLIETSVEWSYKRGWFNLTGDDYSKVLRVIVSPQPLPSFAAADRYLDAHVHTIAEQTGWDGPPEDTPQRNFGGPIAMLLESSYALGLVDAPFQDANYAAFKDRIVVTDHNVFYSQEVHPILEPRLIGPPALKLVPGPSAPGFGPTSTTDGALGERNWYRSNLGRLAGEEVALAAGPNQTGGPRNEGHHFLAYDTAHIEGPWHGGTFLGSELTNPNTPLFVLGIMKAENDTGFGFAAHPASAQPWSSQYFDEFLGRAPHNSGGGPQVNASGTDYIFKGIQLWNTKTDEVAVENDNLDTGDFVVLNPFPGGPDDQRFQPDPKWVDEHEMTLDLYEGLVQSTLIHAFKESPQRKFIRKHYIVGGSDAHGEFNYSDDVPLGTVVDALFDYATVSGTAYGRVLNYTLVHDRTGPGAGADAAIEAYKEGNSVVTDGPICIAHFDSDGRHNPGGEPRWHDAIPTWRWENPEGRIGGTGKFDGGRTVLVPRRVEEDKVYGYLRTVWLKSVLPLATNIPQYDVTRLTPTARIRSKLAAGPEGQAVTSSFPEPVREVSAVMLRGHAPHASPRRDGRCFTNPIWAVPVPIEVVHPGTCSIPAKELKVIFHFPLTMGSGGVFIQPLDGEGNSTGDPIALIPDPGWEPEAGVDSAKYTATNEERIDCPEEMWDADLHEPPELGDVRSYVVYMGGVTEMHGNLLNDIGRTFNVGFGGGTFLALGDSFVAPPGIETFCDVRLNDTFPRTATFQLVTPPVTHGDLFTWNGDGTFEITLLTRGVPVSFIYRIVDGGQESEIVQVTVSGNRTLLVDLETFTDPDSGKAMVRVPCLVLSGKHYPLHQFLLANNPQDTCKPPHWHSPLEVFHLEPPMAGRFDPNPPSCGFGQYKEVPQEAFAVEAAVWEAFLAAHPPLP